MSKYSGKCDFYDWFSKINDDKSIEEKLKNTKVYIGENILPLKMETYKDILPYGGYLTSNICNSDGITIIRLSTRPYVDRREEEILETEMNILKKRYRALKRKKKPITEEELFKSIIWKEKEEYQKKLVENVLVDKKKASIEHIHIDWIDDLFRKPLIEDMVSAGWDYNESYEWVYGWYRFINEVMKYN